MKKPWGLLIILGLLGALLWCRFTLPRYQVIDLSVNQANAVAIAKDYLSKTRGFNIDDYKVAVAFSSDDQIDRYLQKTIGAKASRKFLENLHYDLFAWIIRFTKEKQKEEFKVRISPKTGEVISFYHAIEDTASRPAMDKANAQKTAVDFLKRTFGFTPEEYTLDSDDVRKLDHRMDYSFSFKSNQVDIPWNTAHGGGKAKFLTSIVVSGGEILFFHKNYFEVPEAFSRHVDNLKQTGQNLILIFRILYLALLTCAIIVVVNRKGHLAPRIVKPIYLKMGIFLFVVLVLDMFNNFQDILYSYPTAQSYNDYIIKEIVENLINPFFLIVALVLPGLAGEALRFETGPHEKHRGLMKPALSSFFTRETAGQVFVGACIAAVVLGAQSVIFYLGYTYCGVWDELSTMTKSTTSLFPAFTALLIGIHASFSEEIMFRLFAVNFFKKYGLGSILAVIASAVIWGFGHTGYEIYPMWFRGLEVTCLGLILGFAYLRFGLITTIVAHYLMDSFLTSTPYLLKPQASLDFYSSLLVVALPLIFAALAFILNKPDAERPWVPDFNPQQHFNYGILKELCISKTPEELKVLKKELLQHGWDPAIVARAFKEN